MNPPLPEAALRVVAAAEAAGLTVSVVEMPASTRSADDAAKACGCAVAQIVKSLVFRGRDTHMPYMLLVSGANRVDENGAAAIIGEGLTRPDADYARAVTGFAIGGIPPFGHTTPLATFMDSELLSFDHVWAAAGTPRCVLRLDPRELKAASRAMEMDFAPAI